jgi:hypothetical protein
MQGSEDQPVLNAWQAVQDDAYRITDEGGIDQEIDHFGGRFALAYGQT